MFELIERKRTVCTHSPSKYSEDDDRKTNERAAFKETKERDKIQYLYLEFNFKIFD